MNRNVLILIFIMIISPIASWGAGNWSFDKEKNMIYSVFETIDDFEWHVFIVCKVTPNQIYFEALIPFSEYKKYYTFKLQTKLKYNGMNLVRHDNFFWGKENTPVEIEIDGKGLDGFIRKSGHQVIYKGDKIKNVIGKLKKGRTLIIRKHFWNKHGEKSYPKFSLMGFTNSLSKINFDKGSGLYKEYPLSGLHCKKRETRKLVWIDTSHGSYALNGQAIEWVKSLKKTGKPLLDSDGKPMKIGRNHIPPNKLSDLIEEGLKLCD
ncbi:MAG: hypothetical protein ACNS63_04005 [Candidatus Nitrospinota bacterium M3_3B_026]